LDLSDQLIALAVDLRDVLVGQPAPVLPHLAAVLPPIAFHLIPAHLYLLQAGWSILG
jgi:hypothetical protein